MQLRDVLEALQRMPPWASYAILFGGAFVEYVFPPAPGDLAVLAAAVLVSAFGWSIAPVFLVVTAGSVLGGMADYAVGRWIARTGRAERIRGKKKLAIDVVLDRFERYGSIYLVINRFLPGVRAVFFLAAGMKRFHPLKVLLLATVSATLWNVLLVGVGYAVGHRIDKLEGLLHDNAIVTGVLIAAGAAWLVWRVRQAAREQRRRRRQPDWQECEP